jgi:hypothetical protein
MTAWLGASPTATRVSLATVAAEATAATAPALDAAARRDFGRLASLLNVANGFVPSTMSAIDRVGSCGARAGVGALTVALASPDVLIG